MRYIVETHGAHGWTALLHTDSREQAYRWAHAAREQGRPARIIDTWGSSPIIYAE